MSPARTIHIVDDDEAVRDSLAFSLRCEGYAVQVYGAAVDVLQAAMDEGAACLISDIRMPGMDGLALTRVLRGRGWAMPIYLMSGHSDASLASEAMAAGATKLLEKPLDPRTLGAELAAFEPSSAPR
jgi:two-component system response regulator FixJ